MGFFQRRSAFRVWCLRFEKGHVAVCLLQLRPGVNSPLFVSIRYLAQRGVCTWHFLQSPKPASTNTPSPPRSILSSRLCRYWPRSMSPHAPRPEVTVTSRVYTCHIAHPTNWSTLSTRFKKERVFLVPGREYTERLCLCSKKDRNSLRVLAGVKLCGRGSVTPNLVKSRGSVHITSPPAK